MEPRLYTSLLFHSYRYSKTEHLNIIGPGFIQARCLNGIACDISVLPVSIPYQLQLTT